MRLLCLALLLAASAAAQPAAPATTPPPAAPPAPGWWGGFNARLTAPAGEGQSPLLAAGLFVRTPFGVGPAQVEVGASGAFGPFGGSALSEAHVALGAGASSGPVVVTVAAGPSLASVYRPSLGEHETMPGLYAGARAVVAVLPGLGAGVGGHAHVTAERTVVGIGVSAAFGRLPARALVPDPPPRRRPAR